MRKLLITTTFCLSAMAMPIVGDLVVRQRCLSALAGDKALDLAGAVPGDARAPGGADAGTGDAAQAVADAGTAAPVPAGGGGAARARSAPGSDSGDRIVFAKADDAADAIPARGAKHAVGAPTTSIAGDLPLAWSGMASGAGGFPGPQAFAAGSGGSVRGGSATAAAGGTVTAEASGTGTAVQPFVLGGPVFDRTGTPLVSRVRGASSPQTTGAGSPSRNRLGVDPAILLADLGASDTVPVADITKVGASNPLIDTGPQKTLLLASASAGSVPEPGSLVLVLLGLGLAGLAVRRGYGRRVAH